MNGPAGEFSTTYALKATAAACALVAAGLSGAAGRASAQPINLPPAAVAAARAPAPYPTFASIPALPKDDPTPAQWKARVVATRLTGARLARRADHLPWSLELGETEAWADRERAQATPPAPVTLPADPRTAALAAELRARASAPPRSR